MVLYSSPINPSINLVPPGAIMPFLRGYDSSRCLRLRCKLFPKKAPATPGRFAHAGIMRMVPYYRAAYATVSTNHTKNGIPATCRHAVHVPKALSPALQYWGHRGTILQYRTISVHPFAEGWYLASPACRTSALQGH